MPGTRLHTKHGITLSGKTPGGSRNPERLRSGSTRHRYYERSRGSDIVLGGDRCNAKDPNGLGLCQGNYLG